MDFLSQSRCIFTNPKKLPLNELYLEIKNYKKIKKLPKDQSLDKVKAILNKNYDVRLEKVAALDITWIQKEHPYYLYQPYFTEVPVEENDSFLGKNKLFLENLNFLLCCSYQQFWCHMVYEPKVRQILKSFVYNAVPWYEFKYLQGEYLQLYSEIFEKIGAIYCRLYTFQESNEKYMSESYALNLIETNNIMTYPMIMHLCLLFRNASQDLVNTLMDIYFSEKMKTKYEQDLKKMFDQTLIVFEMSGGLICGFEEQTVKIPIGLSPKPGHFDPFWYEEAATYLLDTAANLNAFIATCKPSVKLALSIGLPYRLTYFYNRVYPALYKVMQYKRNLPFDWLPTKRRILEQMALGRSEFVNIFHVFVSSIIDKIVQAQGNPVLQDTYLEEYIKLISSALEDDFFIFDYHNTNEIDLQLHMITDFYPEIDTMRTNYILECLSMLPNLQCILAKKKLDEEEARKLLEPKAVASSSGDRPRPIKPTEHDKIDEEAVNVRIETVLETLPHLGDGFILKCLELYNYDPIEVISAILDENLSPSLSDIPTDLIRVPPEPEPAQPIMAYVGKKPTYKDTNDLLDDKSDFKQLKEFVLKTNTVNYDTYDDEYDDRYDDEHPVPVFVDAEETNAYKYMENRFEGYDLVSDPSDSSSAEEDAVASGGGRKPREFCEDPAKLRERREAQRRGGGGGGRGGRDVVGKQKGQGQDKSVLNNRDKKNVNKSTRGNHNRKGGATFKRNKGMIPS